MDHAGKLSTMVPLTPGQGLGLTPKPVLPSGSTNKRQRLDFDDDTATSTIFKSTENIARFLIIKSEDCEKPITSLSPFVIEKQIEAIIGMPKSLKKLKNKTLLMETNLKSHTENLLKTTTFFNLPVTVSEHNTLNSSKGIIRDRQLKGVTEADILEYLKSQGVTAVKWFTIKKEGAQWLSGRVLDSRQKGPGFEPHWRHCVVVLEQDTFILAFYWFNPGRPVPI